MAILSRLQIAYFKQWIGIVTHLVPCASGPGIPELHTMKKPEVVANIYAGGFDSDGILNEAKITNAVEDQLIGTGGLDYEGKDIVASKSCDLDEHTVYLNCASAKGPWHLLQLSSFKKLQFP